MVKETKLFRKQAAKAERMSRSVSDTEISERFLNMAKAYRSQADVLKAKKKIRQKATLTASIRQLGNAHLLPRGSS